MPAELKYSVLIPVYNEQESLKFLNEEVFTAMYKLNSPYEVIYINDGSTDNSLAIIKELKKQYPQICLIDSAQRTGQTIAMQKGFESGRGEVWITLDADLQNDPADIPLLIDKIQNGYDVVCGWRKSRQDKPLKTFLSKLGNMLQRLLTRSSIHDVSCTLRAYKRECFTHFKLTWEGQHRYIPLILALQGFRIGEIISHHRQRRFGQSKYKHKRIFKVVLDFFKILSQDRMKQKKFN